MGFEGHLFCLFVFCFVTMYIFVCAVGFDGGKQSPDHGHQPEGHHNGPAVWSV